MVKANTSVNADNLRLEKMAIFETSLKLIRQGKFHATPMSEIALLSRISGTMIFYVFKNRDELLSELADKVLGHIHLTIEEACKRSLGFNDTVRNIWIALYKFYSTYPDVIPFIEQFENVPGKSGVAHTEIFTALINLFKNHAIKSNTPSPEILAWSLHGSVLCAAKLQPETPDELFSLFMDGIYKQISGAIDTQTKK